MSVVAIAVPMIAALVDIFRSRRQEVADKAGVSAETIGRVGEAVELYLTRDERALAAVMSEVDKARQHDTAMTAAQPAPEIVVLMRGLVRPLITMTAFLWYVFARCMGVELLAEDYAIVGGILAFWFGFRPFEKGGRR